jgi:hypothetical protein
MSKYKFGAPREKQENIIFDGPIKNVGNVSIKSTWFPVVMGDRAQWQNSLHITVKRKSKIETYTYGIPGIGYGTPMIFEYTSSEPGVTQMPDIPEEIIPLIHCSFDAGNAAAKTFRYILSKKNLA